MYKPYTPVMVPARRWELQPATEADSRTVLARPTKAKPGRNRTLSKRGSRP